MVQNGGDFLVYENVFTDEDEKEVLHPAHHALRCPVSMYLCGCDTQLAPTFCSRGAVALSTPRKMYPTRPLAHAHAC